jgi:hypothetical protein
MLASPPRRSTLTATLRSQTNHSRRVSLPDQRFILLISHVADPVKSVSCLPVAADPGRQGGGTGAAAAGHEVPRPGQVSERFQPVPDGRDLIGPRVAATWPGTAPIPRATAAARCGAFCSLSRAPRTAVPPAAITSRPRARGRRRTPPARPPRHRRPADPTRRTTLNPRSPPRRRRHAARPASAAARVCSASPGTGRQINKAPAAGSSRQGRRRHERAGVASRQTTVSARAPTVPPGPRPPPPDPPGTSRP